MEGWMVASQSFFLALSRYFSSLLPLNRVLAGPWTQVFHEPFAWIWLSNSLFSKVGFTVAALLMFFRSFVFENGCCVSIWMADWLRAISLGHVSLEPYACLVIIFRVWSLLYSSSRSPWFFSATSLLHVTCFLPHWVFENIFFISLKFNNWNRIVFQF